MLAPNVRFTRTPGRAYSAREYDDARAQQAVEAAGSVCPAPPSPKEESPATSGNPVTMVPLVQGEASHVGVMQRQLSHAFRPERNHGTSMHSAPKSANAAGAGEPPRKSSAPINLSPGAGQPHGPLASQSGSRSQTISPASPSAAQTPARPLSAIPDHLIWEMMSLGASENTGGRLAPRVMPTPSRVGPARVQSSARFTPAPASARETNSAEPTASATRVVVPAPAAAVSYSEKADVGPSAVHLYRQIQLRSPEPAVETIPVSSAEAEQPFSSQPVRTEDVPPVRSAGRRGRGDPFSFVQTEDYLFPSVDLLQEAGPRQAGTMTQEALEQSAGLLESILEDFGVKGEIIDVRPGPVVTLYEFAPAPGVKSSRVINLSDDIARSMSALSARVAVIPGRNVIGIELPNVERETVYLRELIESGSYVGTDYRLPLCLGKTIGGEPVIAELAKMPHLLVAGTTGSGKSVAINTMILSLIYHLSPDECRLIMVDPKMLELSVYDGIPHLLTPVVTDSKKAVLALKWAVREMEERYRKMSRLGVRNIDGFNARVAEARANGETVMLSVPCGFDKATAEQLFEDQELDLKALPYIVVIVDEMADLMMVAGKEIEGAIQRLAQMARAAGIHLIMATQRPSVDVITGTIKANFPTRVSFQVTSKIDSRTILGEQGAEHLLGQGDMLHMKGGGRISRVHGPFVSDREVENVVAHLKTQGQPSYLGSVTEDTEEAAADDKEDAAVFDNTGMGADSDSEDLYERAVKIVQRDKKCSTSYIQRRLSIGYNRAASLVERMEQEGLVGAPNHVGKREILGQRPQEDKED
ncbi:DNA translocase FtsK [Neorhizobium sp. T786]|nr:DNA translocase FtsK [Neorhizobium xiangyangii]MCB5204036.1 DNA translocase FtsK [Neorhizobium xiangyangii]